MDTKSAKADLKLVVNMLMNAVFNDKDRLLEWVQKNQNDPVGATAHAIFVDMVHARSALNKAQLPIDGRIWIAKGGVLDNVVMQVAQLLASNFGKQFASPDFIKGVKNALVELMHQHETSAGGRGMPEPEPQGEPMGEAPDGDESPMPEDDGMGGGLLAPMQGGA